MLILTRKKDESITITDEVSGEKLEILVTEASGYIKLGFTASQRFRIVRSDAGKNRKLIRSDVPV